VRYAALFFPLANIASIKSQDPTATAKSPTEKIERHRHSEQSEESLLRFIHNSTLPFSASIRAQKTFPPSIKFCTELYGTLH
jgi:hypothetical protein